MQAPLALVHERARQLRQRFATRTLGHEIDRAAHRSARRHAAQQRRRPFVHFHALEHLRRHAVKGRQPIQPAQGHVAVRHVEAANAHALKQHPCRTVVEHRRVCAADNVCQPVCLGVLHMFAGVADGGKGRFHHLAATQQPQPRAAGHLPAGMRGRQIHGPQRRMFAHRHRWQSGGCAAAGLAVITRRLRLSGLHTAQGCQSDQARAHGRPPDGMG